MPVLSRRSTLFLSLALSACASESERGSTTSQKSSWPIAFRALSAYEPVSTRLPDQKESGYGRKDIKSPFLMADDVKTVRLSSDAQLRLNSALERGPVDEVPSVIFKDSSRSAYYDLAAGLTLARSLSAAVATTSRPTSQKQRGVTNAAALNISPRRDGSTRLTDARCELRVALNGLLEPPGEQNFDGAVVVGQEVGGEGDLFLCRCLSAAHIAMLAAQQNLRELPLAAYTLGMSVQARRSGEDMPSLAQVNYGGSFPRLRTDVGLASCRPCASGQVRRPAEA